MAASKSRNTKNAKRKRKTRDAQDWSIQQETGRFQTEIIIFVLLAACIILFASNLGLGGIRRKCDQQFRIWAVWADGVYFSDSFFYGISISTYQ